MSAIKKFDEFININEAILSQELPEEEFEKITYPSKLVSRYGKDMIDECINVLRIVKESSDATFYEIIDEYVPKAKLTLMQAEEVVYACDHVFSKAGYYFAAEDDLNRINDKGLVPYDLSDFLEEIWDRI